MSYYRNVYCLIGRKMFIKNIENYELYLAVSLKILIKTKIFLKAYFKKLLEIYYYTLNHNDSNTYFLIKFKLSWKIGLIYTYFFIMICDRTFIYFKIKFIVNSFNAFNNLL